MKNLFKIFKFLCKNNIYKNNKFILFKKIAILGVSLFFLKYNNVFAVNANKNSDALYNSRIEKYRNFLKLNYANGENYGIYVSTKNQDIDFNKINEANELYEKLKKFKQKYEHLSDEDFNNEIYRYVFQNGLKEHKVKTLNRSSFNSFLNSGNVLKLYYVDFLYKDDLINKFKNGENVCLAKKIVNSAYDDVDFNYFSPKTNCETLFKNKYSLEAGPWQFRLCYDVAFDLKTIRQVDWNYLKNLVTIIKYNYPEEFGFLDQIDEYFNENKNNDEVNSELMRSEYLNSIPETLFNSRNVFYDNFYKNKIGYSYFNYLFDKYDAETKFKIEELIKNYSTELENYDVNIGVFTKNDDTYVPYPKIYYCNKNYAMIHNFSFLAKLLKYDLIFCQFDLNQNSEITSNINLKNDDSNKYGDYLVINYENAVVCSDAVYDERSKTDFKILNENKHLSLL